MPTNPRETRFRTLAGVPVHYARSDQYPYGTRGRSYNFYCTNDFLEKLENCFTEMFERIPLGKPQVITCAGTYVNKPPSKHALGRAFDLDAMFWDNKDFITLNYPNDKVFYLGVEAVLRKHFGTVLQFVYDRRHEDHFHFDDGTNPDFNKSWKSYTYFLQTALNNLFDKNVSEDGQYGRETNTAKNEVFDSNNIHREIETKANWFQFLDVCIDTAFGIPQKELTPKELLQSVYETINTSNIDGLTAKKIESSLNSFANHEETLKWLENQQ